MFNVVQKAPAVDPHVNALGVPIAIVLTGGEVSDYKGYLPIMEAEGPAPKVQFMRFVTSWNAASINSKMQDISNTI
jgi:hypothetical protein